MITALKEGIEAHLNALLVYYEKGDFTRAMGEAEWAKKLLQEVSYEVWMREHTSGTVRKK